MFQPSEPFKTIKTLHFPWVLETPKSSHSFCFFQIFRKNGIQKSYFQNGKIYSEGSYKNGEKEGLWKYFNINGDIDTTYYIE